MAGLQSEGKMDTVDVNQELFRSNSASCNTADPLFLELIEKSNGAPAVAPADLYGKNYLPPIIRPFPWRMNGVTIGCTYQSDKGGGGQYEWGGNLINYIQTYYSQSSLTYNGTASTSFSTTNSNGDSVTYERLAVSGIYGEANGNKLGFYLIGREPEHPNDAYAIGMQGFSGGETLFSEIGVNPESVNWKINFGGTVVDAVYNGTILGGAIFTNNESWMISTFGDAADGKTRSFSYVEIYYV